MIDNFWILRDGIPIFLHSRLDQKDLEITSSFFAALSDFVESIKHQEIMAILLEKCKYVYYKEELLYIAEIPIYANEYATKLWLKEIAQIFTKQFQVHIEEPIVELDKYKPFEDVIKNKTNVDLFVQCTNCNGFIISTFMEEQYGSDQRKVVFCSSNCREMYKNTHES